MHKYRRKPIILEAMQFTNNADLIVEWGKGSIVKTIYPTLLYTIYVTGEDAKIHVGDWVIKGVDELFYVCDATIFNDLYEKVAE